MRKRNLTWGVVLAIALLATLTTAIGQAGAANNNPPFEGFSPPGTYTLEVNGEAGNQVVRDGDVLTFDLTEHQYNTCSEGPTTPGCLSNIRWNPWFNRTYVAPFGTGDNWGFTYEIVDPDNDCQSDDYTCTVEITTTRTVPCTGVPFIGNIAPLIMQVQGDLGLGFGSSSLPYILHPRLYLDLGAQDCQPQASLDYYNDELAPLQFNFDASGSLDPDNIDLSDPANPVQPGDGIVSYSWSFGDGAISFDEAPIHIYNEPGDYEVSLTVTDDEGDMDIVVDSVQAVGEVFADFTWSYPDDSDRLTIEFDASPSSSEGEIYFWEWDFGDDETDFDSPVVTHTYAEFGEVDVYLAIEDEFGSYGETIITVDVGADPPTGPSVPEVSSPYGFLYVEGAAGATTEALIPVELSAAADHDVTVSWQTVQPSFDPDAAIPGEDYAAASGTVTIVAGDVDDFITVTILDDSLDEEDESAWIELTGATGATIGSNTFGFVFVEDDDAAPTAQINHAVTTEGDSGTSTVDMTVSLDAASGRQITVDFTSYPLDGVIDGGAADMVATAGTLTFEPGETQKTITLTIVGDTTPEPGLLFGAEWGAVGLANATNAELIHGWAGVGFVLIVDDDIAVS